ncbi:tape measure protein [Runella sp.]|uniref:tape measure protein n=1 Tax=Runella sp. TaxID=1960881 RepID=UPI003D12E9C3
MISYQKLFDFDGLERKIGSLDAEYQKFVQHTADGSNIVKTALSSYAKEITDLIREIKSLNTAQSGSNQKFEQQSEKLSNSIKRHEELKAIIASLTDTQKANEISIDNLKGSLKLLHQEYDKLDPKAADFKAQQQQIADKVKLAKQAIDAQNTTLKAVNQTLGGVVNTYAKLSKETNEFRTRLRNLDNAFDINTGKINKNNKEAVALLYQIQQNDAALKRMDASMGQHQRSVGNYGSALNGVRGNLLAFTGAAFGVDSALTAITKTFEVINSFERYRTALEVASGSTARFNANLVFLEKLANDTGSAIEVLYPTFTKLEAAAKGTRLEGGKVRDIFAGVVKTGAALKLSNEEVEGTLKAIEQAISKGRIQAEEWRGQVGDRLPGAYRLLAEAMGITTAELDKMMQKGEVLAEQVLPKVARQMDKTYGKDAAKNLETMGGQMNRLKNETSLFIDEFSRESGVTRFFGRVTSKVADLVGQLRELYRLAGSSSNVTVDGQTVEDKIAAFQGIDNRRAMSREYRRMYDQRQAIQDRLDSTVYENKAQLEADKNFLRAYDLILAGYDKVYKAELREGQLRAENAKKNDADNKKKEKDKDKELTQLEALLKDLEKLQDVLLDDALADVRNGKAIDLPQKSIDKWKELYSYITKISKETGYDIPAKLREFNNYLDPQRVTYSANTLTPNLDTTALTQKKPIKTADFEAQRKALEERLLLEKQFISERQSLEISFSKSLRGVKQKEKEELMSLLSEIQDAELRGNKERKDAAQAEFDFKKQLYLQDVQNRRMVVEESIQLATMTVQGIFEVTNAYRERDIAGLQTQKEYEMKLAGENAEAKEAIEKRMDARIKELRIKQAKDQKALSVFQIATETAVATMKAYSQIPGPLGIAFAAIVAAQGAVRLATVLATPLPAFKKGTKNAPEGPALVAEEGAELHESQGKYFLHEKPSIVPLKSGDKIYTHAETTRMLADQFKSQELNTVIGRSQITSDMAKNLQVSQQKAQINMHYAIAQQLNMNIDRLGGKFNDAVDRLPKTDFFLDEDGFRKRIQKDNSIITYRNARRRF